MGDATAREDLDRFMPESSRALVDKFATEAADGPDDINHEAALTGKFEKPARVPQPVTGFLVVNADWDPSRTPSEGWNPKTWDNSIADDKKREQARRAALKEARTEKAAVEAMVPGLGKVILEVTTTYRIVEGGGRG